MANPTGKNGARSKLRPDQIEMVKRELDKGTTQSKLARLLNVSVSTIWRISKGHFDSKNLDDEETSNGLTKADQKIIDSFAPQRQERVRGILIEERRRRLEYRKRRREGKRC